MDQELTNIHEQFLMLYTANEAAIRAFVRQLVPTRNDAADVMQRISLVLWKKFGELDEPDAFRKWAFGVARFEALAWIRDKSRDRLVLADDVMMLVADESAGIENQLSIQRDALENCLEKLPAEQQALMIEAYMPDVCMKDVAERSGRTLTAFYQWLHRIRLQLRNCMHRMLQPEGLR